MARSKGNDDGTDQVRITDQFRTRAGMAYELRGRGNRLTLVVSETSDSITPAEWRVEASCPQCPGAEVTYSAKTRVEAVQRTGEKWIAEGEALGLPAFDWTEVIKALTAVRAV